jgi:hypothetical protein
MLVPDSITTEQYVNACKAFAEAVGLDPETACVPMILGSDGIHFSIALTPEGAPRLAPPGVGNAGSILTATGKIEVK